MTTSSDLAHLDATAQADLVRRREILPIDLIEAAIERIEALNPTLNAVITPMYEEARRAAKGKLTDGPFTGVPFVLKDLLASYGGVKMASGSAFLRDFVPDHDSVLVARLKRAGLVVVGKTNTPEFGLSASTEPAAFGPTRNPWNTACIAGGSSGGSGAAVAAGMVPMAHANDGGGSLRVPASCCGLFGLKPTRARNPLGPDYGELASGLAVEHAVTRSVRDSAALLDATAGPDVGDPYWAPQPARPFVQEVGVPPGRLRIAFTTKAPGSLKIHPDCVEAVRDAVDLCADLGHELVDAEPAFDLDYMTEQFTIVWTTWFANSIEDLKRTTGKSLPTEMFEPYTWAIYELGRQHMGSTFVHALKTLHRVSRNIAEFFTKFDMWLTPVLTGPPVPLGTFEAPAENPFQSWDRMADYVLYLRVCNVTGQPAMSVPLFWNHTGLPIGVQFAASFGDEATLFRLAAQLESARPWVGRRPAVSA